MQKKAAMIISFLIIASIFSISSSSGGERGERVVYKNIAVYPSIVPAIKVLEYALRYEWSIDGVHYKFNVTEINMREAMGMGKKPLNTENYDVLVIGASARQYFHGMDAKWKRNVRNFVASGGGYIGICGGANEASLGIEKPTAFFDKIINAGSLAIANVYVDDDQQEEWQYLYKSSGLEGGVPVECNLTDHPIVAISPDNPRIIRYEGGPGMYEGNSTNPLMGDIVPIAIYGEEISDKAPIHFWKKVNGKWQIVKPIKTDLKGKYAAIATTYGNGRIVLWGPHPEELAFLGGHVEEFLGRNKYTLYRKDYLYRWVNGTAQNWSYNWWILRRSVAWAAGIKDEHLPPLDDTMIFFMKPNVWHPAVYIEGRRILPAPWGNTIIGSMNISVYTNVKSDVKFFMDGREMYDDYMPPYEWRMSSRGGKHILRVEVENGGNIAYAEMILYCFP